VGFLNFEVHLPLPRDGHLENIIKINKQPYWKSLPLLEKNAGPTPKK
jgi:hypothetical protein